MEKNIISQIQSLIPKGTMKKPKHILTTPAKLEPFHQSKINHTQPITEKKWAKISNTLSQSRNCQYQNHQREILNKTIHPNKNKATLSDQPKT